MRLKYFFVIAVVAGLAACSPGARVSLPADLPVIDVHRHAPIFSEDAQNQKYLNWVESEFQAVDLKAAVVMGRDWAASVALREAFPGQVLYGASFPCWPMREGPQDTCNWDQGNWPSIESLRSAIEAGHIAVLGELLFSYAGVSPLDPRMEPYWALAAEFDIPVGIHSGYGPPHGFGPRRDPNCCPDFDDAYGNPELYRTILNRYPKLRLWLQHAGAPNLLGQSYDDETFALLRDFPNVYVDLSVVHSNLPAFWVDAIVREYKKRGLLDRIMLGTDGFPLEGVVQRYWAMGFLTEAEKRAILHDNAARFFRVAQEPEDAMR